MTDKFELEEQIMNCWNIVEDLGGLIEYIEEHDTFSDPRTYNLIKALHELYSLKFEKLFNVFENCVDEGKI